MSCEPYDHAPETHANERNLNAFGPHYGSEPMAHNS